MALFGFKKKKEPAPAPKPEPKQPTVPADVKPYQQFYIVDGQWFTNPNYDPTAPKPPKVHVFGLDDDDEEEKEEEDDDF